MPTTRSNDGALDESIEVLARRLGAGQIVTITMSPSGESRWSTRPSLTATSPSAVRGLPQEFSETFAKITLDRSLQAEDWNDLRRITLAANGCMIISPYPSAIGPRPSPVHAFRRELEEHDLFPDFVGSHTSPSGGRHLVAIFSQLNSDIPRPPASFRVIGLITAFNEEDVIRQVIAHLADQGVDVILIDNWSTDATVDRATTMLGNGLIRIEKFPVDGPSSSYEWASLLRHEATIASNENADWFIHHDADEIRRSPWPDRALRDAIYLADYSGFNAVDHTQLDFHPVDNGFVPGQSLEEYFRYFTPVSVVAQDYRVNAWKKLDVSVDLDSSGGHSVQFAGRRVFPYNFLLKHYPIRSQAHGEQKVLRDRKPRWNSDERRRGWHFQYDHIRKGHRFIRCPQELQLFDDSFDESMLLERLSAVGLHSIPARYSWRSRRMVISWLRRIGLLRLALRIQKRIRAALRRDVSLGGR